MSPVKPSLVIIQQTIENHHKQHNPNEKKQKHNRRKTKSTWRIRKKHPNIENERKQEENNKN